MAQTRAKQQAKFTAGSTMRHVLVMTASGSIGLVSVFLVDFANLFYISQLGIAELAAAIGYAGSILAFSTAIGIGLSIAASARVSRHLGAGETAAARRLAGVSLISSGLSALVVVVLLFPWLEDICGLQGASGVTKAYATGFLQIVFPSMPLLCMGMTCSALLRAVGDAKRAMTLTLFAGIATALLDPLLIFGFDMGLTGAAIASVVSRAIMLGLGLYALLHKHDLIGKPELGAARADLAALLHIAVPALLTNVATPVGNAWVTAQIADYGDSAVAAWAIIGRVTPLAFGALFALSGSIGPILGQNLGARLFDRLHMVMRDALIFILVYSLVAWGVLFLLRDVLAQGFGAQGETYTLLVFFCQYLAASFVFNAALFVSNAAFNNLGYPFYSTVFNWGRATLGTVPFTYAGAALAGAKGVLIGQALGGVMFGLAALYVCFRSLAALPERFAQQSGNDENGGEPLPPLQQGEVAALTSGKGGSAA
ncbi:MATE family efflux transporter [Polycladidibacter hongkongensis]|uniref:MATE family efflux transporter n=1 Tax=Polycladidibacter hongkongensis TaxID=1647556 RepID=UPI000A9A8AE0|nr:MATE family efflux transporter [Pseudovibrio hongkongensis]